MSDGWFAQQNPIDNDRIRQIESELERSRTDAENDESESGEIEPGEEETEQ